jgi:hypothetical protein
MLRSSTLFLERRRGATFERNEDGRFALRKRRQEYRRSLRRPTLYPLRLIRDFAYPTSTTARPSTSIFGTIPSPGSVLAAILPFSRCGAPSAVLTVT